MSRAASFTRALGFLAALIAAAVLSGCGGAMYRSGADEMRRPKVAFAVDSDPMGGLIRVNGIRVGTTPSGVAVEVNDDGTVWSDTVISIDHRTNARAAGSEEVRAILFRAGEDLPSRLFFVLGEEPRASGRALLQR